MGEHLPCKQGVKSSNLFISTTTSRRAFWFAAFFIKKYGFTLSAAAPFSTKASFGRLLRLRRKYLYSLTLYLIQKLNGVYKTALYHNRVILEAEPNNINANIMLLFYNILPDKLVGDAEALAAAEKILIQDPKNVTAASYISEHKK